MGRPLRKVPAKIKSKIVSQVLPKEFLQHLKNGSHKLTPNFGSLFCLVLQLEAANVSSTI